ncbi:major facilitator superfamily domain-containing protein [Xylaria arbuscula]|nr:major facilitator superfamily domain-containing protein [Xylaria arbuscula]
MNIMIDTKDLDDHATSQAESTHCEARAPGLNSPEKHVSEVGRDAELNTFAHQPDVEIDAAMNRKLFWQINKRVLPCMLATYFFQSLDKGTLAFASVQGLIDDVHLVGSQYSWLGSILYIGVLVGEYPTNLLLQKLPIAKYLSANVFIWGAVVTTSAAAHNFSGLIVVRLLLGIFEAAVQPAFVLMTNMWYTREEQTILISLWYCMTGVQQMIGGLIAFGVAHYKDGFIKSWQLLFLVLGLATVVWASFMAWWLPDSPMEASCFSEEQKALMIERVRANETGIQNRKFKRYQAIEAFKDPIVWCFASGSLVSNLVIGGLGVFSNLIIASFGFTYLQTQLLNIGSGAVNIILILSSASFSTWSNQTILTMHLWTIPAIIGTAVIYSIPPNSSNRVGLLFAFYATQFMICEVNLAWSLISRNIAGQTKKTYALAINFVFWATGNFIAPQIFQISDGPRYLHGFTAHFALYAVYNVILLVTRWLLVRRNKQKVVVVGGQDHTEHSHAFDDLTDRENPNFRYVY